MTYIRSKRFAEEPLLRLSAAKKKRMNVRNVENSLDTERVEETPETKSIAEMAKYKSEIECNLIKKFYCPTLKNFSFNQRVVSFRGY